MTYTTGHVKRDPVSGSVAVRTSFPDDEPFTGQAWLVATVRNGAHFRPTAVVADWPDLHAPAGLPAEGQGA